MSSASTVEYGTRYVVGVPFQTGSDGQHEIWVALRKSSEMEAFVYVINRGTTSENFFPDYCRLEAYKETKHGMESKVAKTYEPAEYQKKVQNRIAWQSALAAFGSYLANQPQPQTTNYSGTVNGSVYGPGGYTSYSGSYYGSITTWPSARDYADANAKAAAYARDVESQLQVSFGAMLSSLMGPHTLDPGTYYGGRVFFKKEKGKRYELIIPFGGQGFLFTFLFDK